MIAQSCGLCRQGVFLLLLIFQTGRGSSVRKTFVFHFLPLTSYRFCLPDVSFLDAERQCGPAGWGVSCVPASCGHWAYRTKTARGASCSPLVLPTSKSGAQTLPFGFCWQLSQKWLHSLCPYILNILWRCVQLTYLHLKENFVLLY